MKNGRLAVYVLASVFAAVLYAQDIAGDWQGILNSGPKETRHILRITRSEEGSWAAKVFNIDQTRDWGLGLPVNSLTIRDSRVTFTIKPMGVTYEGKVSADRATIAGTWSQGRPEPLVFKRTVGQTVWHDPSPHRILFISVTSNVKLEVLDWGGAGRSLVVLTGQGNTAHVFDQFAAKLNVS